MYAGRTFSKKTGILLGLIISLNGIISGSAVSLGFAGYLQTLTGINFIAGSGLFFIIYASFPSLGKVNYVEFPPLGINGLLAASALAFFAFIGFVLRIKEPGLPRPYRVPINIKNIPLPGVLGVLMTALLLMYTLPDLLKGLV